MKRVALVAIAMGILGACSTTAQVSPAPTKTGLPNPRIATTGKLKIVAPTNGATVKGPDVTVRVELTGATIADQGETTVRPNEGHVHISLDNKVQTIYAGESFVVKNVTGGTHTIQAEFVAADHGFFQPRIIETVFFTVVVE
jgi:hypothetical protein